MLVVIVGSGGREHALALACAADADVVVVPGSPGIEDHDSGIWVSGPVGETQLLDILVAYKADLYVIGPEQPLVDGLADSLRARGCVVFGPGADGAALEGSKALLKEVLDSAGVPCATSVTCRTEAEARAALEDLSEGYVVKTDGLAAGKGVLVTDDLDEAIADAVAKLRGQSFGAAGRTVVVEERLSGPEISVFFVCDGRRAVALPAAQDHKRLLDDDHGPNTGGMGAFSPVPGVGDEVLAELCRDFAEPTLHELTRRGIDFRGVLFGGFMLTSSGPRLLEYNVRFGDPETQVVLPRFDGSLVGLLMCAAQGDVTRAAPWRVRPDAVVAVVAAAAGYPVAPETGAPIAGLEEVGAVPDVRVLHAGTGFDLETGWFVNGGRVLNVVASGATLDEARERAYEGLACISWPGLQYRSDIGAAGLAAAPTLI
jgi:phosphoribosylamine--glycine ligase